VEGHQFDVPVRDATGGMQYRRLVRAFQRIFGATIFFGTDAQRERAAVVHRARFNFMSEARITNRSGSGQGAVIQPAALNLFIWLSYRCFTARGRERVPLFGDFGLISQQGSADYSRDGSFAKPLG
jgi:hypothetical protein